MKFEVDFTIMGNIIIEAENESEARRIFQSKIEEPSPHRAAKLCGASGGTHEDGIEIIDIIMDDIRVETHKNMGDDH